MLSVECNVLRIIIKLNKDKLRILEQESWWENKATFFRIQSNKEKTA